ncbi:hypothetical protein QYB64_003304 [Clostridium perfringens]|nr:hypothetical protein [Clostridium perfringens]
MFKAKVFLCGNVVEVYEYDKPIFSGYKDSKGRRGRRSCASDDEKIKNREKVCRRAMNDLRRLINANFKRGSSRFITLTFKDNVQDLKYSNYEFKKFVKRFEYYLGYKVQYTVVIEFQKRGAIHYHAIFYNIPSKLDLPRCREIWGHGSFNCKRIDNVDNVGAYMVKYLSKNIDDERLKGNKMYFNSRGLVKPKEIKEPVLVSALVGSLQVQAPKFENSYDIKYNDTVQNVVHYKQYIIKD